MAQHAGRVIRRREDPRLITGTGQFLDDLRIPGCLDMAVVRSPHAHARVRAIDTARAAAAPGVAAVVTARELGAGNAPLPLFADHPGLPRPCRLRPLAAERVRFVGEPVAVVLAPDRYRARDAAELVAVDYEPLPAVVDVEAAAGRNAPLVHEEFGTNVVGRWSQRVGDTGPPPAGGCRRARSAASEPGSAVLRR